MKMHKFFSCLTLIAVTFIFSNCYHDKVTTIYESADGKKGGIYYDSFWATEGDFNQADTATLKQVKAFPDFFKCKQCHGWDLEANKVSYIGRGATKTRPNVAAKSLMQMSKDKDPLQLFELIKNGANPSLRRSFSANLAIYDPNTNKTTGDKMPNYGEVLTDAQIWDIVKFLKEERIPTTELYDYTTTGTYPTGKITFSNIGKGGNMDLGKKLFVSKGCSASNCHGVNGTAMLVDNNTYTIGAFIRAKPQEAQHKIKFGQLGSPMKGTDLSSEDMRNLYKAFTDTVAFPLKRF